MARNGGKIVLENNQVTQNKGKVAYQKPLFIKQEEMTFPTEIIEKLNGGRFCLQCSGCHGCR
jgi:hypothetical protein